MKMLVKFVLLVCLIIFSSKYTVSNSIRASLDYNDGNLKETKLFYYYIFDFYY